MINFIDTHNRRLTPSTCDRLALFTRDDGKQYVCPVYMGGNFSINPLKLKDGTLFLSPGSVGPNVRPLQLTQLMRDGRLDVYGGTLKLVSEDEAREELRVAGVINELLSNLEEKYDADLSEIKL